MKSCLFVLLLSLLARTLPAATLVIPDTGWRLWPDTQAAWKNDTLYLPDDVDLAHMPVNAPTGGWDALSSSQGIGVTLPSTVEQHYWGRFGLRPYTKDDYTYGGRDPGVQNGNYEGVSWWWRNVPVPASYAGKLVLLHIRGARQRAEIYVNHQLAGYNIIEETSFDCDITKALRPGQVNQIAIRITNPGGWMDWQDFRSITWGKYTFQRSHGFGGLDRGLILSAHDPVYLADTWVLNTPKARTITAHATVRNTTDMAVTGTINFVVHDPKADKSFVSSQSVSIPPNASVDFGSDLACDNVRLWDLDSPTLYTMKTSLSIDGAKPMRDQAEKTFGFRWFEPRGIGSKAGLYLNGRRIRLYTAISWGYWGLNGLWPTPELADKEVRDAKQLNLDMLNFHRNIGKEEVLARQDQLGLLRYMEPGGGNHYLGQSVPDTQPAPKGPLDTSGKGGEPQDFSQRYMEAKILRMVRQFRSHPSLVIDVIQNETEPNLANPYVFHLLREMHALDPSRVIATKSGISPDHQAWFPPYAADPLADDGTGYSGWHDKHTVGGPGTWQDDMYKGPGDFTHQIDDRREIVDWGEMLGAAVADNHPLIIRQIQAHGGESYDLRDHQQIAAAYHQFLDQWGFRQAFPTDDAFFRDLGNKCYQFWSRVLETARLSESNDILTISGWESTAIENHSGLVDNMRDFKGDPALIASKLAPLLPVVEPRASILETGSSATLDLYLLNETDHPVAGQLHLTMSGPGGKSMDLGTYPAPAYVQDQFVYPVKMAIATPPLAEEGKYKVSVTLDGTSPAQNSETLQAVDTARPDLPAATIGLIGANLGTIKAELARFPQLKVKPYTEGEKYDLVISAPRGNGRVVLFNDGSAVRKTDDAPLYNASIHGTAGLSFHFDVPPGPAKVTLYFCEKENWRVGERLFDIAINGNVVARNFDVFAEAGGNGIALAKTYNIDASGGAVDISVPKASKREAFFNAIKIEAGQKVMGITCGGETYRDKSGLVWTPVPEPPAFSASALDQVRNGTPLLVLASDEMAGDVAARQLAGAGAIQYAGNIGVARAPWMGGWVFVRAHPLYNGLPVNEVMKGDYQAPVSGCFGLMVSGPGVAIVAAYSRDHDRNIGAVTFTANLGKGPIVFHTLTAMHPIMEQRWLGNALAYLLEKHAG